MTTAPMNPLAGASGPGPYAVRTDKLDMGSTSYGEGKETKALKSAEPLAKTESVRATPAAEVRAAATKAPRLFDESGRPEEDIMFGTDAGPGEGSSALGMTKVSMKTSENYCMLYGPSVLLHYDRFIKVDLKLI